ncbi:hypothetical protein [Methanosarcina barkeri]|uniref:hypothetical protein n=1 Tax=Methanosarcina barkeri TaxID=2208 RepID=UPI0006D24265|nr:hypothetical protein [Methanosarcina barkeri]
MLINLLLVLLYIVAIFLSVYISRQKSKTKLKLTQESFTTNINALENDTSSIRQLKDKPYSTDLCSIDSENKKKQEVFREFANSFQDSITVFKRTIPAYREINEMEKYREKWHLECNKLKTVVAFFGLDELKDIIDNVGKTPVIKLKGSDDRTIKSSIINSVCERAFFDEVLMNLFVSYYEESRKTENIWEQIKVDNNKLHPLAEILLKLKKLNFDKDVLTGNILQKILAKTQFFLI